MIHWNFTSCLLLSEIQLLWFSLHLFQKFWTEDASMVLIKQIQGKPADAERKLPVKADGKEMKRPLFVSKPPVIHFKVQLC